MHVTNAAGSANRILSFQSVHILPYMFKHFTSFYICLDLLYLAVLDLACELIATLELLLLQRLRTQDSLCFSAHLLSSSITGMNVERSLLKVHSAQWKESTL